MSPAATGVAVHWMRICVLREVSIGVLWDYIIDRIEVAAISW